MASKTEHDNLLFRVLYGRRNVVLNWIGNPDAEMGFYAEQFHRAAKHLVVSFMNKPGYSDHEAIPIVVMYRMAVELYLKGIAVEANEIADTEAKKTQNVIARFKAVKHRLTPLIDDIEAYFADLGLTWDSDRANARTFDELRAILSDFEAIDPDSFTFRYPISLRGDATVRHHFVFNVPHFVQALDPVLDALDGAFLMLRHYYD